MITVGIDIGTYSIKIAEVESSSKSYAIRKLHEIPFSQNLQADRKIEVIDGLRNFFSSYDLNQTHFVFAIPQQYVSLRFRQFEFRERYKILKTVPFELEDDIPFSQQDSVFEAKILRFSGKGADVMAMAAPKDRVRDVLNLARDCGIEPVIISSESMALANHFEKWMDAPKESAAAQEIPAALPADVVLDIGHMSTKILVYREGAMVAIRYADWGMYHTAQAIGQKYGLNVFQGLRELQNKGFILLDKTAGNKDQVTFSGVIEAALGEMIRQVKLKLLDVQAEFKLEFTRGFLVGGGSQLRNINAFLTQKLEIPFNRFKQFEHHPALAFEPPPPMEAITAVAVGLALEGVKRPKNPAVNFLRGEFERQSQTFEAFWEKYAFTAKVLAAGFVVFFIYAVIRDSLAVRASEASLTVLKQQAANVANLRGKDSSPAKIRKFIGLNKQEMKNRKEAAKVLKINSALDVMAALSRSLPVKSVNFEIRRLTVENDRADIVGAVKNAGDIAKIEQGLKAASSNGKLEKLPVPQTGKNETNFGYRFSVQRLSAGG